MINFSVFGLTNRDKRVYDQLLLQSRTSIRGIAESTGINRGSVYESLKSLMSAGLVATLQQGRTTKYIAEDPEKLHELINERRRNLSDAHADVDVYIQQLALQKIEPSTFQFATFYDGDEGMASILRDVLSTCRVQNVSLYKVISSPKVAEYLYNNFRNFTRERIKKGLCVHVLRQSTKAQKNAKLSEWRVIPDTEFDTGCYTIIYGTKLAIISIDRYNHTSGIIIDNVGVAKTQENIFGLVWNSLE